jgi:hypothetical protein
MGEMTENLKHGLAEMERRGFVITVCEHLASGERRNPERFIRIGNKREVWLCPACSGELFEKIVTEMRRLINVH